MCCAPSSLWFQEDGLAYTGIFRREHVPLALNPVPVRHWHDSVTLAPVKHTAKEFGRCFVAHLGREDEAQLAEGGADNHLLGLEAFCCALHKGNGQPADLRLERPFVTTLPLPLPLLFYLTFAMVQFKSFSTNFHAKTTFFNFTGKKNFSLGCHFSVFLRLI